MTTASTMMVPSNRRDRRMNGFLVVKMSANFCILAERGGEANGNSLWENAPEERASVGTWLQHTGLTPIRNPGSHLQRSRNQPR
jgi:hypothetical protein